MQGAFGDGSPFSLKIHRSKGFVGSSPTSGTPRNHRVIRDSLSGPRTSDPAPAVWLEQPVVASSTKRRRTPIAGSRHPARTGAARSLSRHRQCHGVARSTCEAQMSWTRSGTHLFSRFTSSSVLGSTHSILISPRASG
jgi:hypothetical protein